MKNPLKVAMLAMKGVKTDGPFKKDIPLDKQRKADFVFSSHVEKKLAEIRAKNPRASKSVVEAAE